MKTLLIILPYSLSELLSSVEVVLDITAVSQVVCNDSIYISEIKRRVLLSNLFSSSSIMECTNHRVECYPRVADSENTISVAFQWNRVYFDR